MDDYQTGKSYTLFYRSKTVLENPPLFPSHAGPVPPATAEIFYQARSTPRYKHLGTKEIDGLGCVGYEITTDRGISEKWFAPELNFAVIRNIIPFGPDSHVESSLTDIRRVGEEPDPKFFRIPEDFKMVER